MTAILDDRPFVLPPEREATSPPEARGKARDEVRLLVADPEPTHAVFFELPTFLLPGDLVVVNNSATLSAAVDATIDGLAVVVHFSTWLDDGSWVVEVRGTDGHPARWDALAPGVVATLPGGATVTLVGPWLPPALRLWTARVAGAGVHELLARHGRPITYSYVPGRWTASYYATAFGRIPGSAEMPSAARPFTPMLVTELVSSGVAIAPITLHTGVSSAETGEPPSPERFAVPAATARAVNDTRAGGGRVIAVGTTVTRALETVAADDGRVRPASGWTDLVLSCARPARVVDGLVTGWHAPGASHLDLLEAVAGPSVVRDAYDAALTSGYLWHEFGDSALLFGNGTDRHPCR